MLPFGGRLCAASSSSSSLGFLACRSLAAVPAQAGGWAGGLARQFDGAPYVGGRVFGLACLGRGVFSDGVAPTAPRVSKQHRAPPPAHARSLMACPPVPCMWFALPSSSLCRRRRRCRRCRCAVCGRACSLASDASTGRHCRASSGRSIGRCVIAANAVVARCWEGGTPPGNVGWLRHAAAGSLPFPSRGIAFLFFCRARHHET